tara:strand:- start:286 stop:564 length:279 start_codon:yes stop_codon:yes gene_type:complete
MEEFKDKCQGMEVRLEEIAVDLQELPTDYKLAEQYSNIDQEVYEMLLWYEKIKTEKQIMEQRLEHVNYVIKNLNNDVKNLRLREFSRSQLHR